MAILTWDEDTKRIYEAGVDRGVFYPLENGTYGKGEAWDGLISVNESPSGAEPTALWANNRKYGNIYSNEEFGGSIEAYTYPDGFDECNGVRNVNGVLVTQQTRKPFGASYRTLMGNDAQGTDYGYKIHLVYNAMTTPSEQNNQTINESPETKTMTWNFSTTPVPITVVTGMKPTAHLIVDSTKTTPEKMAALEELLYGTSSEEATLPTPDEVLELVGTEAASTVNEVG